MSTVAPPPVRPAPTRHLADPRRQAAAPVEARWTRPAFWVLLVGTALLYLWDLGASGDANSYYAAAVQAGTQSWKALLFGSLDAGNAITVDKPPAALWVMALSGRLFGFSSWSMLAPQALEGVAAVALLHGAVRRTAGRVAGLVAGAALALTPAAALIFRFNNPDALLVLLMVAGAYAVTRALEGARTRWLVLAGVAIGFAFLTKMGQAFLVLPALSFVYLVAAPTSLGRRVRQLIAAGVALVVSAGWYIALVELWPASSRPYIGGSTDNSLLELALGYNGVARLLGGSGSSSGDGGGAGGGSDAATGTSFGGATGVARLFSNEFGNEISWLLPAALVALVAVLWLRRRAPRTDAARASVLLWGLWLVVSGGVFSYMSGTIHPYYTVALAPAIAALVAIGTREAWRARSVVTGRLALAGIVLAAGGWSFVLLERDSSWYPALRWSVLALTVVAAVVVLAGRRARRLTLVGLTAALVAGLLGTGAFAAATAATPHSGSIPTVGPASAASSSGGMGGMGGMGARPSGVPGAGSGGQAPSGAPGTASSTSGAASQATPMSGSASSVTDVPSFGGGGAGGGGSTTSSAVTKLLTATSSRWSAAVVGAQSAAGLELASGTSVMAIGGWSGSDASLTLAQFKAYVAAGDVHYFIAGGGSGGGMGGSSGVASEITAWVKAHYTATTVGGQSVYDLTAAAS